MFIKNKLIKKLMLSKTFSYNFNITDFYACFLQEDQDSTSGKESLDDLFPTEEEEQSHSMTLLTPLPLLYLLFNTVIYYLVSCYIRR